MNARSHRAIPNGQTRCGPSVKAVVRKKGAFLVHIQTPKFQARSKDQEEGGGAGPSR